MNLDFQAIMVLVLFVTGIIWSIDVLVWAKQRRSKAMTLPADALEEQKAAVLKEPLMVEWSRSFFPIILVVLVLRSFIVEPFRIPSASMMPTLLAGDFILVNKFSYGVRLPVTDTKIIDSGSPQRGDVAVFRYPKDPSVDYIKRIIGLPGDRLAYINEQIYINGKRMPQQSLGAYMGTGIALQMSGASLRQEDLSGVEHQILLMKGRRSGEGEFIVPEGHYFVMGDNRDNSNDSRFWGAVPEENLVGKAFMIWMNWDSANGSVTWNRLGNTIK